MEKNTNCTLVFLKKIAVIDSHLLKLNNSIYDKHYFKSIDYNFRIYFIDVPLQKPALEIYFGSELLEPINNQIHTLSMDISIYNENNIWIYEGNINWNGYDGDGVDEFIIEKKYENFCDFLESLEENYLNTETKYLSIIMKQGNG